MRIYQDAAGTLTASNVNDPVGRIDRAAGAYDLTQTTTLSRPTLGRWPKGEKPRNLLFSSEDFNNTNIWRGSYVSNGVTITHKGVGSNAGRNYVRYDFDGESTSAGLKSVIGGSGFQIPAKIGEVFTASVWCRITENLESMPSNYGVRVDLSGRDGSTSLNISNSTNVRSGEWAKVKTTITITDSRVNVLRLQVGLRTDVGLLPAKFTVEFANLQLERGETDTPYQPTDADGVPLLGYGPVRMLQNRNVFDSTPIGEQITATYVNGFGVSSSVDGIIVDVLDRGYEGGEPYVVLRIYGTSTAQSVRFINVGNGDPTPVQGNKTYVRAKVHLLAGTLVTGESGLSMRAFTNFRENGVGVNGSATTWVPTSGEVFWGASSVAASESVDQAVNRGIYFRIPIGAAVDATVKIKALQINVGDTPVPYQQVINPNDVYEPGAEHIYFLYNDGNDSMNAPLPSGNKYVASVDVLGNITYETTTATSLNVLRKIRTVDVMIKSTPFTDEEKQILEKRWSKYSL